MALNRLMQASADAIARGAGKFFERTENPVERVPNEELQRRVQLRDAVLRMASSADFKMFHEDAVRRGTTLNQFGIEPDKRRLMEMPVSQFHGLKGTALRERINGKEEIFFRITEIRKEGNAAETILEQRKFAANKNNGREQHTNFTAG